MAGMIGVIGGSGFIGTALVRSLRSRGHAVRIIDIARSAAFPDLFVEVDVCDRDRLLAACAGCKILYNLAAVHRDDIEPRSLYDEVNVFGAQHTCAVAEQHGIERIVFTSTVAIYGLADREADEQTVPEPFNDYGRSKLEAEHVFERWAKAAPKRALTIVRPTVVFGPGNRGNVHTLLEQIARGRNVVIGNGQNRKSLAYVENVADFLVHALAFGPGVHVYNYVDKPDISMNELVILASQALNEAPVRPWRIPRGLATAVGEAFDLATKLTGASFPISAIRVRKYGATTQFAAHRVAQSGFVPRNELRASLITTIRHEFGRRPDKPVGPCPAGPPESTAADVSRPPGAG